MSITLREPPEPDNGATHGKIIELIADKTGFPPEAVEQVLDAYYRQLLEESRGNPIVFEDLGAVFVPESFPAEVEFILDE